MARVDHAVLVTLLMNAPLANRRLAPLANRQLHVKRPLALLANRLHHADKAAAFPNLANRPLAKSVRAVPVMLAVPATPAPSRDVAWESEAATAFSVRSEAVRKRTVSANETPDTTTAKCT